MKCQLDKNISILDKLLVYMSSENFVSYQLKQAYLKNDILLIIFIEYSSKLDVQMSQMIDFLQLVFIVMSQIMKAKAGFISKLQNILSDPSYSQVVSWSQNGASFSIYDSQLFEQCVLSSYFRHKRMASFIRQLNMYGFRKCRGDKDILQFQHPLFLKDAPQHHHLIQRKKSIQVRFKSFEENAVSGRDNSESQSLKKVDVMCGEAHEKQWGMVEGMASIRTLFRMGTSEMTIRLNERLTSLCRIDWEQHQPRWGEPMSMVYSRGQLDPWEIQKQQQIQTILMKEAQQHRLNF